MKFFLVGVLVFILTGCSSEDGTSTQQSGEHVWKSQTDNIDKAAEVESMMMDSAEQQRNIIDSNQ